MPTTSRYAYRRGSLEVAPLLGGHRGRNDIARDGSLPRKEIVDIVRLSVHWDKFCHGLAVFRDYDSFMLGLNVVHNREEICLEGICWDFLHPASLNPIVIVPWSHFIEWSRNSQICSITHLGFVRILAQASLYRFAMTVTFQQGSESGHRPRM